MAGEISKELLLEILSTLTKLRKRFPYTLLLYVLTPEQLMRVLDVMQGATITFPTKQELLELVTFAIAKKYKSYDKVPKEVLNGLTRKRYNELDAAIQQSDYEGIPDCEDDELD
jgi:predicted component of type VI protein secretion system